MNLAWDCSFKVDHIDVLHVFMEFQSRFHDYLINVLQLGQVTGFILQMYWISTNQPVYSMDVLYFSQATVFIL